FPLILADHHMPEPDGLGLAGLLAADGGPAGSVILLCTAAASPADADRARGRGIAATVLKPVKLADLAQAMGAALGLLDRDETPTPPSPPVAGAAPLRILLAEDNPINQKLALALLQSRGHRVELVGNGREAVAAHADRPFEMVLMDVEMPEMDGLE